MDVFIGISRRMGYEDIVLGYPRWWEVVSHIQEIRDWGIQIGTRAELRFLKYAHASLQLSYSRFFREYEPGPLPAHFRARPTMQHIALQVGIGATLPRISFKKRAAPKPEGTAAMN